MSLAWEIRHVRDDVAAFHGGDAWGGPQAVRTATFVSASHPVLALGSAQPDSDVDPAVALALGVEVVRRRSGGGAVLLIPGEFVWLDLVIPAGDPLWSDDVARAMEWVGDLWVSALGELGVGELSVHRGAMVTTDWSRQVCWSGLGTGEVVDAAGAKVVGISQRRTRDAARFQSMAHLVWRPERVAALAAAPRPTAVALAPAAAVVSADASAVEAALVAALRRQPG